MTEANLNVDMGGGRQRRVRVDYPSNSQKNRPKPVTEPETRPKLEKIITGDVQKRKQNIFSRVAHDFVAEDSRSVGHYVLLEVLLPAAKKTISDVVSAGIERMLYGDARPARGTRPGYTNYSAAIRSSAPMSDPRPALSRQARVNHEFGEILISSRADAEDVLDRLRDLINEYNVASVADFKELLGITSEFTDNTWGWDDLRSASIRPVRGGYVIDLPRTQALA